MTADLSNWQGVPRPERAVLEGRYARLEPLEVSRHAGHLFESAWQPGAEDRFRYLIEEPPANEADFLAWAGRAEASEDPMFHAVINKATGRAEGRHAFLRIDPANGVIEIGHILWGPAIARSRVATEALYLCARHVFGLGYRRFEWKCNDLNEPSRRAALRFGFRPEGVFRQHMVVKGRNRDTAWYAMTDGDWETLRPEYERWLAPENFDGAGQQLSKLGTRVV